MSYCYGSCNLLVVILAFVYVRKNRCFYLHHRKKTHMDTQNDAIVERRYIKQKHHSWYLCYIDFGGGYSGNQKFYMIQKKSSLSSPGIHRGSITRLVLQGPSPPASLQWRLLRYQQRWEVGPATNSKGCWFFPYFVVAKWVLCFYPKIGAPIFEPPPKSSILTGFFFNIKPIHFGFFSPDFWVDTQVLDFFFNDEIWAVIHEISWLEISWEVALCAMNLSRPHRPKWAVTSWGPWLCMLFFWGMKFPTQLYRDYFISHEISGSLSTNQYFMECQGRGRLVHVAHLSTGFILQAESYPELHQPAFLPAKLAILARAFLNYLWLSNLPASMHFFFQVSSEKERHRFVV